MTRPDPSRARRKPVRQYDDPPQAPARLQSVRGTFRPAAGRARARVITQSQRAQPAVRRRAMSIGVGTLLITVGAILVFALTAGSPHWLNLHVVGIILILAGALGLLLPLMTRSNGSLFRRWVVPMMRPSYDEAPPDQESDLVRRSGVDGDSPTLADDLLDREHDPPI